jgi:hypothetical protein
MQRADSIDGISWASRERASAYFDQQMPAKSHTWSTRGSALLDTVDEAVGTHRINDGGNS